MIRHAVINDASRIAEIHVLGWQCAYKGIVSDEYLFKTISVNKRIKYFKKAIEENLEETYVYDDTGLIKAFMTIGKSRNEDKKKAFELWGLYVEPLLKGQGIGTEMIKYCEKCAIEREYKEIILWVFKKNEKSRKFYEKMGYLSDGKEEMIEYFKELEVRYSKIL